MIYLCTRNSLIKMSGALKRFFEIFLKKVHQIFGGFKNMIYLCTTFQLQKMKRESERKWFFDLLVFILREKCSIYLSISF